MMLCDVQLHDLSEVTYVRLDSSHATNRAWEAHLSTNDGFKCIELIWRQLELHRGRGKSSRKGVRDERFEARG